MTVCLFLRLLVLSVGVGIQGLVYELRPVALRCRKSGQRDEEVYGHSPQIMFIHHIRGSIGSYCIPSLS